MDQPTIIQGLSAEERDDLRAAIDATADTYGDRDSGDADTDAEDRAWVARLRKLKARL